MEKPVYTIVLDKLELLLNGTISQLENAKQSFLYNDTDCIINNEVILRKNNKLHNPTFNSCYNVIVNNQLFGQLYYNYNKEYRYTIDTPILLHIENNILYTEGLANKLKILFQSLPSVEFIKYQNLDIAIDGYNLVSKHEGFVKSKQYQRKVNIKDISIRFDERNNEANGYIIGSKESDKYISIYKKQQEIVHSRKSYIRDFWNKNGMPHCDVKLIDRVEARLTTKELVNFSKDLNDLENPSYLAGFFKLKFENYLVFSNKNNRKERRHLIHWHSLKALKIEKVKTTNKATDDLYSKRITLHTLFDDFLCTGDENTFNTFLKLVLQNNLIDWTLKKALFWKKECQC